MLLIHVFLEDPGWGTVSETLDKAKEFYDANPLRDALPVLGAAVGLRTLRSLGFDIVRFIVAARNFVQEYESASQWLTEHTT